MTLKHVKQTSQRAGMSNATGACTRMIHECPQYRREGAYAIAWGEG